MSSRFIKLVISLFVAVFDGVIRSVRPGQCVVINYHSISHESKSRFGQQLDLLLRLARPIPAGAALPMEKGGRYVAITVDDFFQSFLINGLPELCRRKIPVTLFPPTGFLGQKSSWKDYGGENKVGEEVASADDLKRIAQLDHVDFGSHCVSHPDLTLLSETEARNELRLSKESLEALIGREVTTLSFPYGSYGPRELGLAREAGYTFFFGSTPQTLFARFEGGLVGRVDVQPTDWNIEFRLKVLGAYRWIGRASAWKRKCRACFNHLPQIEKPIHG